MSRNGNYGKAASRKRLKLGVKPRHGGKVLNRTAKFAALLVAMFTLVACAGRPEGNLVPVSVTAPGATNVEMLVATTRGEDPNPAVMFNGERAHGLRFADIDVSIPPDANRKIGDVQWPSSPPGDPERDFVTTQAERLDLPALKATFDRRLRTGPTKQVLIFVHGFNTRFEEAVYRFAQIVHDSKAPVLPFLFTWPSRGDLLNYVYDRDSAMYSRDALEDVLQAMVNDPNVGSVSVLAHSMGNVVAVEALRQMAIRDKGLPAKIKHIMLASPDIDFEVFRREIAEIEKSGRTAPVTLFVSNDDQALSASSFLAGGEPRLGSLDPRVEPFRSNLKRAGVEVVDLSSYQSEDSLNHSKFADADVVTSIGARLAAGQTLTDQHTLPGNILSAQ